MGTNGHHRESTGQLRREAEERRRAIKETAAQLENRLRERTGQIGEAIDRTRNQLGVVDELVHRYRYWFIGGALGIGFALTRGRRPKPPQLPPAEGDGIRYVVVDKPHQPKGLVRSLAGGLAALALRHGVTWLTHRLAAAQEQDEAPFSPPRRDPHARY